MGKQRSRVQYEKSTLGCRTCKIRRVKCDETQPECLKCRSTGRRCEGPATKKYNFVIQSTAQLKRTPTRLDFSLQHPISDVCPHAEARAFDFFITKAAIDMTGKLDSGLWAHLVPQVARTDPVIWYSVLAFASLWENALTIQPRRDPRSGEIDSARQQALQWYAYALSRQRARTPESDTIEQLLTCILFSGIEFQNQNFVDAFQVLRTAFRMLVPCMTSPRRIFNDSLGNQLTTVLLRNACVMLTSEPTVATALNEMTDTSKFTEALFHILLAVHGLIKEVYFAITRPEQASEEATRHHCNALLQLLDYWSVAASNLSAQGPSISQTYPEVDPFNILHAYHRVAAFWLHFISTIQITATTAEDFFHSVIDTAGQVVEANDAFSEPTFGGALSPYFLDLSVLPPLYFVTMMCGDARIEDRALAMMTMYTSQKTGGQAHGAIAMPRAHVSDSRVLVAKVLWTVDGEQVLVDIYNDTA